MGEALVKTVFDGCAKPWHDCCLYCANDFECRSECTRVCPCSCTISTHETGEADEEIEVEGKE